MKRPNEYSKPLAGVRTESYHPRHCLDTNNQYVIDLNTYIDYLEKQQKRRYSEEDLLSAFEAGMMFIGEDKGSFREWFEQFKNK